MPKIITLEDLAYFKELQETSLFKKMTKIVSSNLLNPNLTIVGRLTPNGTIDHLTDYFHTQKIPAVSGDIFNFYIKGNNDVAIDRGGSFVFYDDEDNIVVSGSSTTLVTSMTVPDNEDIAYCVFNFQTNATPENTMIVKNASPLPTVFEPYFLPYYIMGDDFAQPYLTNEILKNTKEYTIAFNNQTKWSLNWFSADNFDLRIVLPAGYFYVIDNKGTQTRFSHAEEESFDLGNSKMLVFNKALNTFRIVDYPSNELDAINDIPMAMKRGLSLVSFAFDLGNQNNLFKDDTVGYENTVIGGIDVEEKYEFDMNWSDFCLVGDNMCIFTESSDDHSAPNGTLTVVKLLSNGNYETVNSISHNLGHCNTVSYCKRTDTLIMGNGGNASNPEPAQIMIIKNFASLIDNPNTEDIDYYNDCLVIDIEDAGLNWGIKLNVCWGESNFGNCDIAYCITEDTDGVTKHVRKIQLGKGLNQLQYGTIQSVGESDFNGTFRIISQYRDIMASRIVNNGSKYYNGKLYEAIGHTGCWIIASELKRQNTGGYKLNRKYLQETFQKPDGTTQNSNAEGIEICDGKIYLGIIGQELGRIIIVGRFENIL